jgi:hypothetical protein
MLFGIIRKKAIVMASPMPSPGLIEASALEGLGAAAFITVA